MSDLRVRLAGVGPHLEGTNHAANPGLSPGLWRTVCDAGFEDADHPAWLPSTAPITCPRCTAEQ